LFVGELLCGIPWGIFREHHRHSTSRSEF
jgi:hypothetical protein